MKYFLSFIGLLSLSLYLSAEEIPKREINTGDIAPNIILRDLNNKLIICKDILKEKPILINFFFTGCAPCKKEIPELENLNDKYKDKIQIFLIATDKEGYEAVKPYVDKMKIRMDVLIDKYSDVVKEFNIIKYPTVYIIDRNRKVRYYQSGYNDDNILKIENIIKNLR